ncbi:UPF0561 protein C2orf68 [Amphibalanus amphitrite]|uniref:UPF0561 protein C2orf68 n=1 Tax=Amphibalanus amphitrite TaxID=1232801 RepID=A0A6A4WBP5_AMPAM|nr:UPF0561 protein C2orf68 [Amphibalanus amphitrite]
MEMYTKTARLNMEHGFVKFVVRNQLDRDRYDQEMREKMDQRSSQTVPARRTRRVPRRPDRAVYTPPVARKPTVPPRAVLFRLEYCDTSSGAVRHESFLEGTDLAEFCASFAKKAGLDEKRQRALLERLQKEVGQDESSNTRQ